MKPGLIFAFVLAIGIAVAMYFSLFSDGPDRAAYARQIEKERQEKDEFMRSGEGSPFLSDSIPFYGLNYFPPNMAFKVMARLEPITQKDVRVLTTSDGQTKSYLPYAYAAFKLNGEEHRLLILEVMDRGPFRGTLFLAFADATSAEETYGAGRYLDVKKVAGATLMPLDFNNAYNPYCAYNHRFSCPLPPKENVLPVRIEAGEKNYLPD
jgi:uncharacterized protein (DUF1684 family)